MERLTAAMSMILRFGLVEGGGQITTRALSSSNIAACPPLPTPQSLAQWKLIPRLHETRICVSRLHMPDINLFEQDHRTIKHCLGPMLGLKRFRCASITIAGIELTPRIKKGPFNLGKLRI